VLSAGVLPGDTQSLSKPAYAALNLFFGMLILISGFVYTATRRPKETTTQTGGRQVQYQGYVWSFLLASFATLWAVLGELATLSFLLTEIGLQGFLSGGSLHIFQGALLLAGLLALVYAWRSVAAIVSTQTDRETQRSQLESQIRRLSPQAVPRRNEIEPALPSWSLL
jgi:cytochrome c oxidase subunit IV